MEVGENDAFDDMRPVRLLKGLTPHRGLRKGENLGRIAQPAFHLGPHHLWRHWATFVKEDIPLSVVETVPVDNFCGRAVM